MSKVRVWKSASSVARNLRIHSLSGRSWKLRWKPVCGSTEYEMSRWIKDQPFKDDCPRAIFAERQTFGRGQQGREWHSPRGGVWVSAAFPMPKMPNSSGIFGLAVALSLVESFEKQGLFVRIKWPNDLMIGQKKLAGLLITLKHLVIDKLS